MFNVIISVCMVLNSDNMSRDCLETNPLRVVGEGDQQMTRHSRAPGARRGRQQR